MDLSLGQCATLMDLARAIIRRALAGEDPLAGPLSLPASLPPVPPGAMAVDGILLRDAPSTPQSTPQSAPIAICCDPVLVQPAGCFVSLHSLQSRRLRGCVGRLDATLSLAEAVRVTAIGVLDDPRFGHCPVCLDELELLELEISVVSPLQPVEHPLDFDLMEHGIYLTIGQRSGCFLPQVARETGWGREQLLARLCSEKMGLPADGWREPRARLSVFTTLTIGPEPFVLPGSMIDGD